MLLDKVHELRKALFEEGLCGVEGDVGRQRMTGDDRGLTSGQL